VPGVWKESKQKKKLEEVEGRPEDAEKETNRRNKKLK